MQSSNYADEACFDIYGETYHDIKGNSPTLVSQFAFNSYTLSREDPIGDHTNDGLIKINLINYWTGNTYLKGDKFPALIRIFGQIIIFYALIYKKNK